MKRRRRHSNRKGYRQIKSGATQRRAMKLARKYVKEKEDATRTDKQ